MSLFRKNIVTIVPFKLSVVSISVISMMLLAGCGYRILSSECRHNNMPAYLLSIKPILNRTPIPKLDWRVTDYIIKELANWPGIRIVAYDEADYVIEGEILSYKSQIPYAYDKEQNPLEYKINLSMSFSLTKGGASSEKEEAPGNGSGPWRQFIPQLQEEEIYRIYPSGLSESKLSQWHAEERAIKRMIKRVVDQLIGITSRCY